MITWPSSAFKSTSVEWIPEGGLISGGASVSGISQVIDLTGGPYWRLRLNVFIRTRAQQSAARAFQGLMTGGAAIEVGPCDRLRPLPSGYQSGGVPHSDDTPFSDDTLYQGSPATASVVGTIALRATTATLEIDVPLIGGEAFTIVHPRMAARRYVVTGITSQGGGSAVITFYPPMREAVEDGTEVDFNNPRCTMRLADPSAFSLAISKGWMQTSVEFVEVFGDFGSTPPAVSDFTVTDTGAGQATVEFRTPYASTFGKYAIKRGASGVSLASATLINGPTTAATGTLVSVNHTGLSGTYRWWVVTYTADEVEGEAVYYEAAIT